MDSFAKRAFRLAVAPARFALAQTRTNIKVLASLREDYRNLEPALQRASAETVDNLVRVLVAAEQSLPPDIARLTPGEREQQLRESLARGEAHMLAAVGELYRSYRLLTADKGGMIIENPSQDSFKPGTTNTRRD